MGIFRIKVLSVIFLTIIPFVANQVLGKNNGKNGSTDKTSAETETDNLIIYPVANLTKHNYTFAGEWESVKLDFTCKTKDKSSLDSLLLISCDSIQKCQTFLECIDHKGKKCMTPAFSFSSGKITTGEKCNKEKKEEMRKTPSNPLKLSKPNSNSDNSQSDCLTLSPSDDVEEDFSGVVECTSGHFQKKLWFFTYKAEHSRFLSLDSAPSDLINMTIARYPVINGELKHEIFLSSSHHFEKSDFIYADTAVFVECQLEPFFFGEDAQEKVQIILTHRDGSTTNFTKTDDELSIYVKGTKIRVSPDLVSISCAAPLLNQTMVKVSLNFTVKVPPLNLTVPAFPNLVNSKGSSKIAIDQKMGCKFTGAEEKIEENREILRNLSTGVRKNVLKSVLTFLKFRDQTNQKFNCGPVIDSSNGPFHFLLDFVPTPAKINNTIESQGYLEEYQEDYEITSGLNEAGENFLRFGVKIKPNMKKMVNVMKLPILRCRYYGDPKPHVTWMENSSVVLQTVGVPDPDIHTTLKSEISYLELFQDESDVQFQTNYTCIAENYLGRSVLHFIVESVTVVDEVAEVKQGFVEIVNFLRAKFDNDSKIIVESQETERGGTSNRDVNESFLPSSYFFVLLFILLILFGVNLAVCLEIFLPQWRNFNYKIQRQSIRNFFCFSCGESSGNKRTNSTGHLNLHMELQEENVV